MKILNLLHCSTIFLTQRQGLHDPERRQPPILRRPEREQEGRPPVHQVPQRVHPGQEKRGRPRGPEEVPEPGLLLALPRDRLHRHLHPHRDLPLQLPRVPLPALFDHHFLHLLLDFRDGPFVCGGALADQGEDRLHPGQEPHAQVRGQLQFGQQEDARQDRVRRALARDFQENAHHYFGANRDRLNFASARLFVL